MADLQEMTYFLAKVEKKIEDERNGKIKRMVEQFLVNAVNVTDVEKQIYSEYEGYPGDWAIHSVTATKIIKVVEPSTNSTGGRRPA